MTPITADPKVRHLINTFTTDLVEVIHRGVIDTLDQTLNLSFLPAKPVARRRRKILVLPPVKAKKALPAAHPVSKEVTGRVVTFLVGRKDPIDVPELMSKLDMKEQTLRIALRQLVNDGALVTTKAGRTGRKLLYATA